MIIDNSNGEAAIGSNDFADLFPTNWDDFNLDSLSGLDAGVNRLLSHDDAGAAQQQLPGSPSSSSSSMSPTTTSSMSQQQRGGKQQYESVTKPRMTGPGRHAKQPRPKAQNLFNVFANPTPPMQPAMAPMMAAGFGYGLSPLMTTTAAPSEPFPWMSRTAMPSGMSPTGMMYGGAAMPSMGSPQFGYATHQQPYFPMYHPQPPQMTMKLPVQALHRSEPAPSASQSNAGFVAPILLPSDLGNGKSNSSNGTGEVDPSAITSAITSFLGGPGGAGENQNMRLYQKTFEAFVLEEAKIDYGNVTVVELKKLLRKYHLAATGKKEELIAMVKQVASFLKQLPADQKEESCSEETKDGAEERTESVISNGSSANKRQDLALEAFLA